MKQYVTLIFVGISFFLLPHILNAQSKKNVVTVKAHTKTEMAYGHPQTIGEVKDILENNEAYTALKDLIENHHVTIVYADNSFLGNNNLKRGDFVVSFNSALQTIEEVTKRDSLDTILINTYDRNRAYITSVTQVKDIKPGDIYYNAVQSLLEQWGINAPFTKAAVLNANSLFYEDELSDILRVTLGFEYSKGKPGRVPVKRYRFAILLDEAINLKMQQIEMLANEKRAKAEAEKARVNAIIKQIEQNHRDSVSKEIELRKIEAQKKEAEARKLLEDSTKK
ncbi:MAG: hypothetical protein ACRDE8_14255 [Ginsengibacter sp.]